MLFECLSSEFDFGKFKGCELGEVLMCSPEYVKWAIENTNGGVCVFTDRTIEEIKIVFPDFFRKNKGLLELILEIQNEYYKMEEWEEEMREREYELKEETDTYDRYNGSYAQDEMGYSDDDIDTIFDGDPSAYWNID